MKKILALLFLLSISANLYAYSIVPKIGVDLPGTFRSDYEVAAGYTAGIEARYPVSDYFAVGVGFEFLLNRTISNKLPGEYFTDKNFGFFPAYLSILCYPFGNFDEYKPYLRIDGGYNLAFTIDDSVDSSSGVYYGGAIGFELFNKYIFEMYSSMHEAKDNNVNITYKKISFKVGYKFEL